MTPLTLETESLVVEIRPLDRLLRISREEAILSSQQMTQVMVRGLAHEIKNPLGGLRGAAQLLARELESEHLLDYTNVIIDEADRLRNLVDRLLSTPRRLLREPVNIHEVLEHVRQLVEAETQGELPIQRDYDPSIPELPGDREQLIQAVLNIARNAQQALCDTPAPEIRFRTRIAAPVHHRQEASPPGVPDRHLRQRPGHSAGYASTTSSSRWSAATPKAPGLGLSIAQAIISQHQRHDRMQQPPGQYRLLDTVPLENSND